MAIFRGFKPQAMQRIAGRLGYTGSMENFDSYLEQNPDKKRQMIVFQEAAKEMARGGVVRMQEGGSPDPILATGEITSPGFPSDGKPGDPINPPPEARIPTPPNLTPIVDFPTIDPNAQADPRALPQQNVPQLNVAEDSSIGDIAAQQMTTPGLPEGTTVVPVGTQITAGQTVQEGTGQVSGQVNVPTTTADTTMVNQPTDMTANLMDAQTVTDNVNTALDTVQAAQTDPDDPRSKVIAAEQTESSVSDLEAAQGKAHILENPVQRQIQDGELIDGVANAEKAAKFAEQIDAATATPSEKATVQGQLSSLTANFDATNPPAWAAGAIRGVQAAMQQRGIGASSMAGQALIQASIESALPIAQADASIQAQFETQNLSNRQQRAMLAAQQRANFIGLEFDQAFQARVQNAARIGDIANQNFNAEQQVQLENSKLANTVNLQNLSNAQALVMAQASALSSMDLSNLNNRQQSAVKNAESFLQTDMANLTNQQQTELFKAQQRIQSMFTDQAAQNASRQFNATSQNQTDQFFANLANQVAQFNASQANAQAQYNAGQVNTIERFNSELNNQRDQFNAQNQLVIAQNNAQWRRELATADTTAVNRANELNANAILDISNQAYNNLWSYYGDTMEWAWTSAENSQDRLADMAIAQLDAQTRKEVVAEQSGSQTGQAVGGLIGTVLGAGIEHGFGNLFCWVAREVYGKGDPRWFVFRMWIKYDAPEWLQKIYKRYGKWYANFISNKPVFKWATKKLMNLVVEKKRSEVYARI